MAATKGIAMVTGAGSGLGRAAATTLAEDGFTLVLAGRRADALEETAQATRASGAPTLVVATDITDEGSVAELFAATEETFGRLDFLFNNAGQLGPRAPLEEVSLGEWLETVATNLTGTFLCLRAAMALMKRQDPAGGRIVNNGSVAAHSPRAGLAAYTATKHGVAGLTKQAALEGREHSICVGQIDIGNAATSILPNPAEGTMSVDTVSGAIRYMANLPLDANVLQMTVLARTMPFVGRG